MRLTNQLLLIELVVEPASWKGIGQIGSSPQLMGGKKQQDVKLMGSFSYYQLWNLTESNYVPEKTPK